MLLPLAARAAEATMQLHELIAQALQNNPEISMFAARSESARHRIPQAESLADPMVMFGYQNEGFSRFTYSEAADAQFMFSASQMFPYPGKLAVKGRMAGQEVENLEAATSFVRLNTIRVITELFHDLFFSYKSLDIFAARVALFGRLEDAASARYGAGMGSLQEVVMAQTEKYMLLEKETMQRQKINSAKAMLSSTIGSTSSSTLGVPVEPPRSTFTMTVDEAVTLAETLSPVIAGKEKMVAAAETKVKMAEQEYYPDFTVTATFGKKGSDFDDMWSLTTSLNVPIYFQTKQREGVLESQARLTEAKLDLAAAKLMVAATIRDNYAMAESSESLMDLYKGGLIPKTYQDFDLAMNGYVNGKTEIFTVINRLKSLIDFELLYWERFTEREKAIARIKAAVGIATGADISSPGGGKTP